MGNRDRGPVLRTILDRYTSQAFPDESDSWPRIHAAIERRRRIRHRLRNSAFSTALAMVVLVGMANLALWLLDRGPFRPSPAHAMSQAYENLLSVSTVRYTVTGDWSPSNFGIALYAPLTDEELESLDPEAQPSDRLGTVVYWSQDLYLYEEQGVYDFDAQTYQSTVSRLPTEEALAAYPGLDRRRTMSETVFADGDLYVLDLDRSGYWVQVETGQPPMPFTATAALGYGPKGGLEPVQDSRSEVAELPVTELDGTKVRHIRATETSADGESYETVELWIGVDDGLPRKATIERREPLDLIEYSGEILGLLSKLDVARPRWEVGDVEGQLPERPVVLRGDGEVPEEQTWHWEYTFEGFNEPVDIHPPELLEQGITLNALDPDSSMTGRFNAYNEYFVSALYRLTGVPLPGKASGSETDGSK